MDEEKRNRVKNLQADAKIENYSEYLRIKKCNEDESKLWLEKFQESLEKNEN